jgi:hypothetical protein
MQRIVQLSDGCYWHAMTQVLIRHWSHQNIPTMLFNLYGQNILSIMVKTYCQLWSKHTVNYGQNILSIMVKTYCQLWSKHTVNYGQSILSIMVKTYCQLWSEHTVNYGQNILSIHRDVQWWCNESAACQKQMQSVKTVKDPWQCRHRSAQHIKDGCQHGISGDINVGMVNQNLKLQISKWRGSRNGYA